MKRLVALTITLFLSTLLFAQEEVEHNFEMKPQKTNCEDLLLEGQTPEKQVNLIENAVFRFQQDFKLNRTQGFQAAWYYSCDNKNGYVIAKVDNQKKLYAGITKEGWEAFISSGDFLTYIKKHFQPLN